MAGTVDIFSGTGTEAAKLCSQSDALDVAAGKVLATAISIAQFHRLTGAYISSLGVDSIPGKRGVRDRAVIATDPLAHVIEAGYMRQTANGMQHVPGQFVLTRAAAETPGVG